MDWISNTDTSWWADLAMMPVRPRKSPNGRWKQLDTGALTRGTLLRKIILLTVAENLTTDDWLIKSRHEWAELCRVNYSTIERRLEDLRKLRFISISHKSEPNGRPQVLALQVNWKNIDKRANGMRQEWK